MLYVIYLIGVIILSLVYFVKHNSLVIHIGNYVYNSQFTYKTASKAGIIFFWPLAVLLVVFGAIKSNV